MRSQATTERTDLAIAFGAVVEERLRQMPDGSKRRLGEALGQTGPAASSLVSELLRKRKGVPSSQFAAVAEFLGLRQSDLLDEMVEWLRAHGK